MGEKPEPPNHLDKEIKNAAKATLPKKKHSYAWPSVATAAVLVLSITLVLKVMQQEPLVETTLNTISADDQGSPSIMLQESEEGSADTMDKEKPELKRYRALKKQAAPAPARSVTSGTASFEAAPADVAEPKSSKMQPINCSEITLPESDSSKEWIRQYQKAVELGQLEMAKCIQQAYLSKFGQALPAE
jgi:hypothetical protein